MNRACRRALKREQAAHDRALTDLRAAQLRARTPAVTTPTDLAQLAWARQFGATAENAVAGFPATALAVQLLLIKQAQASLPSLTETVCRTAAELIEAANEYQPAAPLPKPDDLEAGDQLATARTVKRCERTAVSHLRAERRAAQAGTVAQQAPPVVVSNNGQQHRLVLTTPGESPPM